MQTRLQYSAAPQTMTTGLAGYANDGAQRFARAAHALRRAVGFAIFASGLAVLAAQALPHLSGV